jgi:hypothetical protein
MVGDSNTRVILLGIIPIMMMAIDLHKAVLVGTAFFMMIGNVSNIHLNHNNCSCLTLLRIR